MFAQSVIFAIVFSVIVLVKFSDSQYAVPEPKIDVFSKGFRVAIPHQDGIKLFAFHGNINKPMNELEAGEYSRDVLQKEGGYWVYENTKTKLKVGDVIYYWMFVIRYNLGYRYDNGKFEVKEITTFKPLETIQQSQSASESHIDDENNWYFEPIDKLTFAQKNKKDQKQSPVTPTEHKPVSTCCQLFLNVSNHIISLAEQVEKLTEENRILSELAQKDEYYATTLRVFGKYPTEYYMTPKEFAENLVSEKLNLSGVTVVEAKKIPDNGISFRVKSVKDKVKIIVAAKDRLKGSNYELMW